jgi:prepilin-type N-terminal cleavage/methylation domain-containing protein
MLDRQSAPEGRHAGFTLIELLITLAIAAILLVMALPSFNEFRERSLLRGTTDSVLALVQLARFEAVQRDRPATMTFLAPGAPTLWCVGAREGRNGCDCFVTDPTAADFCDLGSFPSLDPASALAPRDQAVALLRGVRVAVGPDFGGGNRFIINPKLGTLDDPTQFGSVTLQSPTDTLAYQSRVDISPLARAAACAPNAASHSVGFSPCP